MPRDVIYVPGLPASELYSVGPAGGRKKIYPRSLRRLLELFGKKLDTRLLGPQRLDDPDPVEAGEPIDRTRLLVVDAKYARSLYDLLIDECGLTEARIHKVGWDWRRPAADPRAEQRLAAVIRKAPRGSVLVLHSTGGLLARYVLEKHPSLCGRLGAVMAFGVPWIGTLKSLAVIVEKASINAATRPVAQQVMGRSWAAVDLLPRVSAGLTVKGNGQPYDLFGSTDWLPESPAWLRPAVADRLAHSLATLGAPDGAWSPDVDLHNVAGFGVETTVSARIVGGEVELNVTGGGGDLDFEAKRQGDATIPFRSAAAASGPRVSSWIVPIGAYRKMGKKKHGSLWSNPAGVKALEHVVAGAPRAPLTELCLDTDAYSPGTKIRLRYSLQDASGAPVQGLLRITAPATATSPTTFPTDPRGYGTLVLDRSLFRRFTQGGTERRRIKAQLENPSDVEPGKVHALVPA